MKVKKYVTKTEEVYLTVNGVTLLSAKEYEKCGHIIRVLEDCWWLRSSCNKIDPAAAVDCYGDMRACNVHEYLAVRPALEISGIKGKFKPGDRFHLFGYDWTVISNRRAICEETVGWCHFRKEAEAPNANDYEASDVKKYLEDWFNNQKISL